MNRRNLWVAWAVIVGAAFAIVAVTGAQGSLYMIIAIVAALGYTLIAVLTRKPSAEPGRSFPPGPEA